jgi:hypothetical protein
MSCLYLFATGLGHTLQGGLQLHAVKRELLDQVDGLTTTSHCCSSTKRRGSSSGSSWQQLVLPHQRCIEHTARLLLALCRNQSPHQQLH